MLRQDATSTRQLCCSRSSPTTTWRTSPPRPPWPSTTLRSRKVLLCAVCKPTQGAKLLLHTEVTERRQDKRKRMRRKGKEDRGADGEKSGGRDGGGEDGGGRGSS
eukprot:766508-Hanusia_phi.AAC.3